MSPAKPGAAPTARKRSTTAGLTAFEYIDSLESLSDPAAIQEAFAAALGRLGITNFALLQVSPDPGAMSRNIIDERMPQGWKQRYFEQGYAAHDPCVSEVMTNLEPFLWSEAFARSQRDRIQRRIFDEAADFNLNEGMCIPIYGPRRYVAFATLAGMQIDVAPGSRAALHVMALYTHNKLLNLASSPRPNQPNLTRREAECLRWVAQGKSDWEIGEILSISERTAHWYIECAKRKLGVATRVQAAMRAFADGMITL